MDIIIGGKQKNVNNTRHLYSIERTIHNFFEEQVIKTPNNIAIVFDRECITYDELNRKSNKLANEIISYEIKENDIVAIMIERSIDMMVSILAVLKSGAAYMPINTGYPEDRIQYMLTDSEAKLLLYSQKLYGLESNVKSIDVSIDKSNFKDTNPTINISSEDLAYLIYTSGSTGRPKGVMIRHNSVVNRLLWMRDNYDVSKYDIFLQKTPYVFDVSVWELFLWFFSGSKLCLCKQGQESNVEYLIKTIENHKVTLCHFVPSMLNVFLDYIKHRNLAYRIKSLTKVFSSGEVLSYSTVKRFNSLITSANSTELHNLYGPTETTVDVTYFNCTNYTSAEGIIPIGQPIWNTKIYIVKDNYVICSEGEVGEIFIAGDCVGKGYINNTELTNERFIQDFDCENQLMYKTGDLGKWNNGYIEYLGRLDNQVKLRGNRVELEEIERALCQFDSISNAVVCVVGDGDNKNLIAFYTSYYELSKMSIERFLKEKLPDYMIPVNYIKIPEFKLTSSGKIDRRLLVSNSNLCESKEQSHENNYADCTETKVLKIIKNNVNKQILNEIQLDMNLSDAGIDSITFMGIVVELEETFNFEFDDDMLVISSISNIETLVKYVKSKS